MDLPTAKLIINKYRQKCRIQSEQILNWKKAYNIQRQQQITVGQLKTEQLNSLTSQLLLLESRLRRKQRHIANILIETESTILRQQKIIDQLSSRLVDYKLDSCNEELETLNDSDSAVVLEDIDSDSNNASITSNNLRRRYMHGCNGGNSNNGIGEVTIVRSVSDAIDSALNKYLPGANINRLNRSNCYLRRPDILETVYSVEEDAETDAAEKRDNFRKQSKLSAKTSDDIENDKADGISIGVSECASEPSPMTYQHINNNMMPDKSRNVFNYNRVMSNHRSVTKPKDVKYKRINKAKSKSLEELRGRLKHWVDKGNSNSFDSKIPAQSYV